jgi:hypothetical protein
MKKLAVEQWALRAAQHRKLTSPMADAFIGRRAIAKAHPVHDFLFTYYNLSPTKLKQWVPRYDEVLEMPLEFREEYPWLNEQWFMWEGGALRSNPGRIHTNIIGLTQFVMKLCENILGRAPRFGCYGLHEWAMVYKLTAEEIRHREKPLRLSAEEISRFVESQTLCCTHYDAFRFFTKEAGPLNIVQPKLETRLELEQSGCIHANMDIYKWSIKLWPWVGSDFLAKAFFLAHEAREIDMRASPYDLSQDGYVPICIETEAGRRQYQHEQQNLTEKANRLREELLQFCKEFACWGR